MLQSYLTQAAGLPWEAVPEHTNVGGRPSNVNNNGIGHTRQERSTPHAVGRARGESEDWVLHGFFTTEYKQV
jgi:hypothetical protein